jgi:transposase
MFRSAPALTINQVEREQLQRLTRAGKTPQRVALRARIILAAADGRSNYAIAKALKITRPTVLLWRARYRDSGLPGLLKDAKSPGRKRKLSTEPTKSAIFALLHSPPSQHNINRTSWRLADIRQCLLEQGISVSRNHPIHGYLCDCFACVDAGRIVGDIAGGVVNSIRAKHLAEPFNV